MPSAKVLSVGPKAIFKIGDEVQIIKYPYLDNYPNTFEYQHPNVPNLTGVGLIDGCTALDGGSWDLIGIERIKEEDNK